MLMFLALATSTIQTREIKVTAYPVGLSQFTDSTPCISANNENICEAVERGEMVGAMNGVPFGAIIQTPWGGVRIIDRKNKRYSSNWLDIAYGKNKIKEAKKFGVKKIQSIYYLP